MALGNYLRKLKILMKIVSIQLLSGNRTFSNYLKLFHCLHYLRKKLRVMCFNMLLVNVVEAMFNLPALHVSRIIIHKSSMNYSITTAFSINFFKNFSLLIVKSSYGLVYNLFHVLTITLYCDL